MDPLVFIRVLIHYSPPSLGAIAFGELDDGNFLGSVQVVLLQQEFQAIQV